MSEIHIYCKFTNELEPEEIRNYVDVYEAVYGKGSDVMDIFTSKYVKNIYGPSVHVFALLDNKCVGIQSFLRNDVDGQLAYQSGDSAVLNECRGKKVFSKMVMLGLDVIPGDAIVYGFPNNNSLPAFKKMNWQLMERKKYKLYSPKDVSSISEIDDEYLRWILTRNKNVRLVKKHNKYLLIRKRTKNIYMIYGTVSSDAYYQYIDLHINGLFIILMIYSHKGKYGNGMVPIFAPNSSIVNLPDYKIDTLLVR